MVIESDNDPLIEPALREALKKTYAKAGVYTFHQAGHFSLPESSRGIHRPSKDIFQK